MSDALAAKLLAGSPGEFFDVIVVFDGPRASERARALAGPFQIEREFQIIHGFQATLPAPAIWALSRAPGLVRIQENGTVRALDLPSNDDTGVTTARASHLVDGSGVTVCVLDTGINPNHEMFDTRVWTPGDFMDFTPNNIQSPYDDQGHGSHVSGILAGDGVGAETVIAPQAEGVAPGVTLKVGKVLDASGDGSDAQVIAGIEWCAGIADIVSMSLGALPTDGSDALSLAANCAADPTYDVSCGGADPVIVVVSAGNSGAEPNTVGTPGVAQNAITVGSFAEWSGEPGFGWQDDGVYLNPFSSRGPVVNAGGAPLWMKPDIVGPGSRVLSAYVNSPTAASQQPDYYAVADGTSMSTPFVAGVIALMLEADPSLGVWDPTGPDNRLPHEKVRELLALTSVDVGPPGQDNEYGHGLVDAMAAVSAALGSPGGATEYPLQAPISDTIANHGTWTHEFSVSQDYVDQRLPIAATLTIEGECTRFFLGICFAGYSYWDPDLEMVAERHVGGPNWQQVFADVDPVSGIGEVTRSECPASGECWNSVGRVEVVHFIPDEAGLYRIRVWPSADPQTNNGAGGDFSFELSMFDAGPPVNTPPTAGFTFACTDLGCNFTDTSTDNGTVVGWSWNFGDGQTSTAQSPSHSYAAGGTFTVTLTATDDGGLTDGASQSVTVTAPNPPPVASFNAPCTDLTCNFADTSTDNGSIVSWSWTFGDGNTSPSQNPTYSYTAGGTYTVSLTVMDDGGLTDTASQSVTVAAANLPPVAGHTSSCTYLDCTFTDTSFDTDGTIVAWNWSFGDGGTSTEQNPSHSYSEVQFPIVSLTVTDNDGATDQYSVLLATLTDPPDPDPNTAPVAYAQSVIAVKNTPVAITLTGYDADGDPLTYTVASQPSNGALSGAAPNLTYTPDTRYVGLDAFSFYVNDGTINSTVVNVTIDVLRKPPPSTDPVPPNASFTYDCTGLTCTFTDTSTDSDGTITSWLWSFGDGAEATGPVEVHTYAAEGTYNVGVGVVDNDGQLDSAYQSVTLGGGGGDVALSVLATKVKGVKTVDLFWSGATTTNVNIFRDGSVVVTTPNDGEFSETLGKGGGTYGYHVCEAGPSPACSPVVNAVF